MFISKEKYESLLESLQSAETRLELEKELNQQNRSRLKHFLDHYGLSQLEAEPVKYCLHPGYPRFKPERLVSALSEGDLHQLLKAILGHLIEEQRKEAADSEKERLVSEIIESINEAPVLESASESLLKVVPGTNLGLSDGGS